MSISQCLVAAGAASAEPSIGVVVATGLAIVFSVLIILYLLITVEGIIFKSIDARKSGAPKATAKPAADKSFEAARMQTNTGAGAAAMAVQPGISAEVVAAITAALSCMEGGSRYTIRSVTRAKTGRGAWGNAAATSYTEPF